jgi:hypothetical protein
VARVTASPLPWLASRQTDDWTVLYTLQMENAPQPRVIDAERLEDGVIITFEDGKTAVYSATLLRSIFYEAKELHPD